MEKQINNQKNNNSLAPARTDSLVQTNYAQINGVEYLAQKEIKTLFVGIIVLLEDSLERGEIDEGLFSFLRKRILDLGNGAIRKLEEQIDLFLRVQEIKREQNSKGGGYEAKR